jgi:hypothetical protein
MRGKEKKPSRPDNSGTPKVISVDRFPTTQSSTDRGLKIIEQLVKGNEELQRSFHQLKEVLLHTPALLEKELDRREKKNKQLSIYYLRIFWIGTKVKIFLCLQDLETKMKKHFEGAHNNKERLQFFELAMTDILSDLPDFFSSDFPDEVAPQISACDEFHSQNFATIFLDFADQVNTKKEERIDPVTYQKLMGFFIGIIKAEKATQTQDWQEVLYELFSAPRDPVTLQNNEPALRAAFDSARFIDTMMRLVKKKLFHSLINPGDPDHPLTLQFLESLQITASSSASFEVRGVEMTHCFYATILHQLFFAAIDITDANLFLQTIRTFKNKAQNSPRNAHTYNDLIQQMFQINRVNNSMYALSIEDVFERCMNPQDQSPTSGQLYATCDLLSELFQKQKLDLYLSSEPSAHTPHASPRTAQDDLCLKKENFLSTMTMERDPQGSFFIQVVIALNYFPNTTEGSPIVVPFQVTLDPGSAKIHSHLSFKSITDEKRIFSSTALTYVQQFLLICSQYYETKIAQQKSIDAQELSQILGEKTFSGGSVSNAEPGNQNKPKKRKASRVLQIEEDQFKGTTLDQRDSDRSSLPKKIHKSSALIDRIASAPRKGPDSTLIPKLTAFFANYDSFIKNLSAGDVDRMENISGPGGEVILRIEYGNLRIFLTIPKTVEGDSEKVTLFFHVLPRKDSYVANESNPYIEARAHTALSEYYERREREKNKKK